MVYWRSRRPCGSRLHRAGGESAVGTRLTQGLLSLWPSALVYIYSFAQLASVWISAQRALSILRRIDNTLLLLLMLFLCAIVLLPFLAKVVSAYPFLKTSAVLYSGYLLFHTVLTYDGPLYVPQCSHGCGSNAGGASSISATVRNRTCGPNARVRGGVRVAARLVRVDLGCVDLLADTARTASGPGHASPTGSLTPLVRATRAVLIGMTRARTGTPFLAPMMPLSVG